MKPSTLSESELESLKSVLRSAKGDDVAALRKSIKEKEFEVAFDKRDVERCLAITPLKELSRQWLEGLLNIAQSYNKIRDWRRKQCIVNDIEKAIQKIDNRPESPDRRRLMDRLLRYENHYSSGAEGHPPKDLSRSA